MGRKALSLRAQRHVSIHFTVHKDKEINLHVAAISIVA
jgi:hypothetical protein